MSGGADWEDMADSAEAVEQAADAGEESTGGTPARLKRVLGLASKVGVDQPTAEIELSELQDKYGVRRSQARIARVGLSYLPDGADAVLSSGDGRPSRAADLVGALLDEVKERLAGREGADDGE